MAGQPTVDSSGVYFPPGTPWQVVNAYYAAVVRNQQIKAAQDAQPEPWEAALGNFQTQVLNPYLSSWIQQPFQDYRATYGANELIRGQQAQIDATTAALQQRAEDAYRQQQIENEAYGAAGGALLNQMQPRIGDEASDTGVTAPYGSYEDPQYASPGPTFPGYNPYQGAIAPEAVQVEPPVATPGAASWQQAYEPDPFYGPPDTSTSPIGPPAPGGPDPATFPPQQYAGRTSMNEATGERFVSDGMAWNPVGTQTASTGGPAEDYLAGPPPLPEEALYPQGAPAAAPPPLPPEPAAVAAPAAAPAAPAMVPETVPTIAAPRSRTMGTTTVTPSLSDAIRLLAGIDPTQAGMMLRGIEKPGVLSALDPLRQEKLAAEIGNLLKRGDLIGAQTGKVGAETDRTLQQTVALRVKNETIARVTEDFRKGVIGQEEWKIQMAAAYGKFGGGAGAAQSGDTKTFITAYATVKSDPANAGKTEHEYRELAATWLQQQAEAIERSKALGRASAETGRPAAEQIAKHTGYQQASSQLGAISALVPRVDLTKIVGGFAPWLDEIARTGMTGKWGPGDYIPSIIIPEGMRKQLTKEEQDFISLTESYADTVLRLKSGAQINEQEFKRMLKFLPTTASTPDAFRAQLGTAFDDMDRWLDAFYRASHDYKMMVPEDSLQKQIARRALKTAVPTLPYDDASVQIFLSNPKNAAGLEQMMRQFIPAWKPR